MREISGYLKTIKDLGERGAIKTILKFLESMPNMPIPFGDDVSAFPINGEKLVIVKVDMLVGKTDVPPGMSLRQAARKAIIMNVSDFAAKGVIPLAAMVSLGLPPNLTEDDVKEIGLGINEGAREYGAYVIGGDTNEASDLIIDCALFGLCDGSRIVRRSGAKPGDIVAVTGFFGKPPSGLKILLEGLTLTERIRKPLVESVLMPKARLREGLALAGLGVLTASIDSSDGLAWSLYELSEASKVGFLINKIPVAPEVELFAEEYNLDPFSLCLYGGEEYELVVTIKPDMWREAKKALDSIGAPLIEIGKVIEERMIVAEIEGVRIPIEKKGWEHFKGP